MKLYLSVFTMVMLLSFGYFWLKSSTETISENMDKMIVMPEATKSIPVAEPAKPADSLAVNPFLGEKSDTTFKMVKGYHEIDWKFLSKVKFNEVYVDSLQSYVPFPMFHPMIESLEGKKIQISGYVIPISETGDESILVLSANPYSSCFFCGQAGPESVMDIKVKTKIKRIKQDERHTFRGQLKLNDSDLFYLNYIMEDAELVK